MSAPYILGPGVLIGPLTVLNTVLVYTCGVELRLSSVKTALRHYSPKRWATENLWEEYRLKPRNFIRCICTTLFFHRTWCPCRPRYLIRMLYVFRSPLYGYISICFSCWWTFGFFPDLAIMNKSAMNIAYTSTCGYIIFISSGRISRSVVAGSHGVYFYKKLPHCSLNGLYHFTSPPTM